MLLKLSTKRLSELDQRWIIMQVTKHCWYIQSWPKIPAPLQLCQKMQHFSQKIVPIANVLLFTCLLFCLHCNNTKKLRRKVNLIISHRTKNGLGQNYWHLVKIVRNNCFSSMWCSCNLYLDTPVAINRCGQYSNHTCNQLKWRKVDSTFVLCVTLSMEKRVESVKSCLWIWEKKLWKNMDNLKATSPSPEILMFLCPLCAISSRGLQPMAL